MAAPLTVGIVGGGYISKRRHIPVWQELPETDVVAIADLDEAKVRSTRADFDIPQGFTDVSEMIERVQPDVVDICTPPQTHADLGVTAFEGGCHVVVEKPLALTGEDAQRLVDSAEANDRKLCTIHQMLFYPPVQRARRLIGGGEIGDVQGVRVFISTPAERYQLDEDSWIHGFDGGVLEETGPHALYLSQPFVGDVEHLAAVETKRTDTPWAAGDDFAISLAGSDATSTIRIVHHSNFRAAELDIWGSEGRLKIDLQTMQLHRFRRRSLENTELARSAVAEGVNQIGSVVKNGVKTASGTFRSGHETLIREFASALLEGSESPVTADHALQNVRLLERCVDQLENRG